MPASVQLQRTNSTFRLNRLHITSKAIIVSQKIILFTRGFPKLKRAPFMSLWKLRQDFLHTSNNLAGVLAKIISIRLSVTIRLFYIFGKHSIILVASTSFHSGYMRTLDGDRGLCAAAEISPSPQRKLS